MSTDHPDNANDHPPNTSNWSQLRAVAKHFEPNSARANESSAKVPTIPPAGQATTSIISAQDRSKYPRQVRKGQTFSVEASHYDNGLTEPTNQSWLGFQTVAKARDAITNLITWPPYAFRRIILQDLSNPEDPQYSMLRDGFVKGGRKDAVFTLQRISIDEPEA